MNKKKKKMIDYGRYGYFFIAPFFITYLVFQLWPLINTFYYSTLTTTNVTDVNSWSLQDFRIL